MLHTEVNLPKFDKLKFVCSQQSQMNLKLIATWIQTKEAQAWMTNDYGRVQIETLIMHCRIGASVKGVSTIKEQTLNNEKLYIGSIKVYISYTNKLMKLSWNYLMGLIMNELFS